MRFITLIAGLFPLISPILEAQRPLDARDLYERLIVIAPMTGRGTYNDPRRPLFTAATSSTEDRISGRGILAFSYQLSDDGNFAVVELVARDRKAFAAILADRRTDIKVFERGKASAAVAESEIRKYIRNFDVNKFGARAH